MKSVYTLLVVLYALLILLALAGCGGMFQGPRGLPGVPGIGITGGTGPGGVDGTGCTVATLAVGSPGAPNGGALVTCSDGSSSVVFNGSAGVNGTNGQDAVSITPVQFCSGFTQTYPNTFAESGICIGNVLYGVYSANGGFLAELPPGTYSSNGINSSCTFTIGADCVVSQ